MHLHCLLSHFAVPFDLCQVEPPLPGPTVCAAACWVISITDVIPLLGWWCPSLWSGINWTISQGFCQVYLFYKHNWQPGLFSLNPACQIHRSDSVLFVVFTNRVGICINLEVVILGILHQLFLKIKENQQKLMTISFFINLTWTWKIKQTMVSTFYSTMSMFHKFI